jgi:Sulfotransferase family
MPAGVPLALSVEEFLARARERTGIDLVDRGAVEPLSVWLKSLNEESGLHASGAKGMEQKILRHLCNRLRMQRDFARHPEIAEQTLGAPIFLCGMARTGSTKTQKLLAASGDFNWLPYWQTLNPCLLSGSRQESPQARIEDSDAFTRWFDVASPETRFGHAFQTHAPEEESLILEHSLKSPVALGWSPIDGYLSWLATQNMSTQFVYLRDTLKYLQWQGLASESRRWILKSPLYTGMEPLLLGVFPDACLVMTHRHPVVTIPSGLRLLELFHKPFTECRTDPEKYLAGMAGAIDRHLQIRSTMSDHEILDIDFREIIGSVRSLVEKIYTFSGVRLSAESLKRMLDWDHNDRSHSVGKHVYALEDYDLREATVQHRFAGYIEFLRLTFGEVK